MCRSQGCFGGGTSRHSRPTNDVANAMRGDAGDVKRAIAVAGPARPTGGVAGRGGAAFARDEAGVPLQPGTEAGVSGVLVHDAGDGVVAALDVAAELSGERVGGPPGGLSSSSPQPWPVTGSARR